MRLPRQRSFPASDFAGLCANRVKAGDYWCLTNAIYTLSVQIRQTSVGCALVPLGDPSALLFSKAYTTVAQVRRHHHLIVGRKGIIKFAQLCVCADFFLDKGAGFPAIERGRMC